MRKIVFLQILTTLGIVAISALIGGENAALSALFGGLACDVPNALFALNLEIISRFSPKHSPVFFLIGEFIKIITIGLLLCLVVMLYRDLVWPALIVSIIVTLNCSFLGLLLNRE